MNLFHGGLSTQPQIMRVEKNLNIAHLQKSPGDLNSVSPLSLSDAALFGSAYRYIIMHDPRIEINFQCGDAFIPYII